MNGSEMNTVKVRPSAPMDHPETRWPKGTRSRLRVPANATLARCSRNRAIFSGIMTDPAGE